METKNEEHPLKVRSTRGVVTAGFRLFMGNFRRIFRLTWLPALLCGLVSGLYNLMAVKASSAAMQLLGGLGLGYDQLPTLTSQSLFQSGLTLLDAIVSLVFVSYVFSLLAAHRTEGTVPRAPRWWTLPDSRSLVLTLASAMVWFVVALVVVGLPAVVLYLGLSHHSVVTVVAGLLLLLVLLLLALPLLYPLLRFLTTRDTRLQRILLPGYRDGLRHWGAIFAVLFVVLLFVAVVLGVTMLPTVVLLTANLVSEAGALMGDATGMPSYMGWLSFVVFTFSGFIQVYVLAAAHFPLYYLAGSIEQQENQRHEKANTVY